MRSNIVFNFISRLYSAFSTFLFVPAYIAILGPDGYSVIALSILIATVILVLEVGLTPAISREMARQDVSDGDRRRAFVAIERLFIVFLLLVSIVGLLLSDVLAKQFISDTEINPKLLSSCIALVSIEAGLQLLLRFHIGVLIGLERQVFASIFNMVWATLRNGVVVAIVWLNPQLDAFFGWQLASTFFVVLLLKVNSVKVLKAWPSTKGLIFDFETLRRLRGFAGGMLLISLVTLANTQLDRLLIGSLASLRDLGAYTLAATLGTAMLMAASPIMTAVQPRLTTFFTRHQTSEASSLFRRSSRLVALIVCAPTVMLCLFPEAVLTAWIGNSELVSAAAPLVPYLVAANAFIALAMVGYAVALANGYTRFNNAVGIASLALSIPGYFLALNHFGTVGVAFLYLLIQMGSTLCFSWLAMNKFLGGEFWLHHLSSYAPPFAGAVIGAILFSALLGDAPDDRLAILAWLCGGTVATGFAGAATAMATWKVTELWVTSS